MDIRVCSPLVFGRRTDSFSFEMGLSLEIWLVMLWKARDPAFLRELPLFYKNTCTQSRNMYD